MGKSCISQAVDRNNGSEILEKPCGSDNGCLVNYDKNVVAISRRPRAKQAGIRGKGRGRGRGAEALPTVDRFWARVQKSNDPDACWIFAGAPCNQAGHLHIATENGQRVFAHRFSYTLHAGLIPDGMVIMHTCDVPSCVNPAHLRIGTQRDNVHDAIRKGRFAPWAHPNTIAAKHHRGHAETLAAVPSAEKPTSRTHTERVS